MFIDDATGRLMTLHFTATESTFSYFEALGKYLKALGVAASVPYVFGFLGLTVYAATLASGRLHRKRPALLAVSYVRAAFTLYYAYGASDLVSCVSDSRRRRSCYTAA